MRTLPTESVKLKNLVILATFQLLPNAKINLHYWQMRRELSFWQETFSTFEKQESEMAVTREIKTK